MLSKTILAAVMASSAMAATPAGFEPGSENPLVVTFGGSNTAQDGNVLARDATQTAPTIGTQTQLEGSSFAILMIDLDIPTESPPATDTLLHWLQTGLTQSTAATTVGSVEAFVFEVPTTPAAFAPYLGPNPPARIPLSHRYTQFIVDTSAATEENLAVLQTAAASRRGFNALSVLTEAGLQDKVLAGNFFNVTNPGPLLNVANSTSGGASPTGAVPGGSSSTPAGGVPPISASPVMHTVSRLCLGIVMMGAVFFTL